jgi:hypothetical protein
MAIAIQRMLPWILTRISSACTCPKSRGCSTKRSCARWQCCPHLACQSSTVRSSRPKAMQVDPAYPVSAISSESCLGSFPIRCATSSSDRVRLFGAPHNRASPVRRSSLKGANQRASNPSGPKYAPRIDPAVAPNESVSLPWVNWLHSRSPEPPGLRRAVGDRSCVAGLFYITALGWT